MQGDEHDRQPASPRLSTEEARAGATPHMTRYVLGWGLGLVIIGFVAILIFYMLRT
jgi:hypothetical protein